MTRPKAFDPEAGFLYFHLVDISHCLSECVGFLIYVGPGECVSVVFEQELPFGVPGKHPYVLHFPHVLLPDSLLGVDTAGYAARVVTLDYYQSSEYACRVVVILRVIDQSAAVADDGDVGVAERFTLLEEIL